MANPVLATLAGQVQRTVGVMESARTYITGSADRFKAALAEALKLGATQEELAPVQAEVDAMSAETELLASAIAANPVQ